MALLFAIDKLLKEEILTSRAKFGVDLRPRTNAPPKIRRWIEENRNKFVSKITVCRKPITGAIKNVLNIITLGQFNKSLKGLHYEDIFHLYIYITLGTKTWRIEKNEVVDLTVDRPDRGEDCKGIDLRGMIIEDIPIREKKGIAFSSSAKPITFKKVEKVFRRRITLGEFIDNGDKFQNEFWAYNPKGNNCQNFAESLLVGNKLIDMFDDTHKFIKQDSEAIFRDNPKYLAKFGKTLTDIAAVFNLIKEGR